MTQSLQMATSQHRRHSSARCHRLSLLMFPCLWAALLQGCAFLPHDTHLRSINSRANVVVNPSVPKATRVAVMPFTAPTGHLGTEASELFSSELRTTRLYRMVDAAQVTNMWGGPVANESDLNMLKIARIAASLGVDGIVVGSMDGCRTVSHQGKIRSSAGMAARLIICKSGEIAWSVNLLARADKSETPPSDHTRAVIREMVAGLYQAMLDINSAAPPPIHGGAASPSIPRADSGEARPSAIPQQPIVDFSVSQYGMNEITIAWTNIGPSARRLLIERSDQSAGPFYRIASVPAKRHSFVDKGEVAPLQDGVAYSYRVKLVFDDKTVSAPTLSKKGSTVRPPTPPSNIVANVSNGLITVCWNSDASHGALFRVWRNGFFSDTLIATTNQPHCELPMIGRKRADKFYMTMVDSNGHESAPSCVFDLDSETEHPARGDNQ